jgi:hypothetical protein
MPIALRNDNSACPDLVFAGLYDCVLTKALKSAVEACLDPGDHLFHLALFLKEVLDLGYNTANLVDIAESPVVIFLDCPDRRTLKRVSTLINPRKIILMLAEHPAYQPRHMAEVMRLSTLIIHSYLVPAINLPSQSNLSSTSFVYKSVPRLDSSDWPLSTSSYDASIFCSDLVKRSPSMYAFRRHLINSACSVFGDRFAHFGRNWERASISLHTPINSLRNLGAKWTKELIYDYPRVDMSSFCGAPSQKTPLFSCNTTFAIENYMAPERYTTEKPLECLSYGCLPLYSGPSNSNWLANFFPVRDPNAIDLLSDAISFSEVGRGHTEKLAERSREDINSYLSTDDGRTSLQYLYAQIHELQT